MIQGIEQPNIIQINSNLRLNKFNDCFDFAIHWYQYLKEMSLFLLVM